MLAVLSRFISRLAVLCLLAALTLTARAQNQPTRPAPAPPVPPLREVSLDSVQVLPSAVDYSGWLLLDKDIQLELGGAVDNLYNFKFERAEKQFRSLRRRYPQHPMPYFLLGLSTWWKLQPAKFTPDATPYDRLLLAYLDTATTCAEQLVRRDPNNYEAFFFLSAAASFDARLNAERHNWRRATVASRRALTYLQKSQQVNGLSPEFLFGTGLFNYYAVWIPDHYPLLKPVLLFFPRGNKDLGLAQLRQVAASGFYTGVEAKSFLAHILYNDENKSAAALPLARELALKYPDNSYFARFYALLCFQQGEFAECERQSKDILAKIAAGLPGYEGISGRYASYFLGYLSQTRRQPGPARDYYQRCLVFAESTGDTQAGYYVFASAALGRLADRDHDYPTARRYFSEVADKGSRHDPATVEAKTWLRAHRP